MLGQWIQNQGPGSSQHGGLVAQREQRSHASSFSTLAGNFDCKLNQRLKDSRIVFRYLT
jgi:hypothetical protein